MLLTGPVVTDGSEALVPAELDLKKPDYLRAYLFSKTIAYIML
jgi:hypothetical protein